MKTFLGLSALLAAGFFALGPAMGQTASPQQTSSATTPSTLSAPTLSASAMSPASMGTAGSAAPTMAAPTMSAPAETSGAAKNQGNARLTYTNCNVDGRYIAITFDDGPNPATTPKLLKILADRGIKATFFVLGNRAVESPELLKQMAAAGHEIGNHSWSHPQLSKVSVAEADKQIADTSAAIEKATGKKPIYLRPPYGDMTVALRHHLEDKYDLTLIYWSVDPLDWKNRNTDSIYNKIMAQVHPGSIILAHDIHATTVAAMPKVLDALLAKGYKFVTVSELIAMNKPGAPKTTVASLSGTSTRTAKKEKAAKPASTASAASKPKPASASQTSQNRTSHSIGLF